MTKEQKDDNILAFIKYKGAMVNEGYLDTRKSGEALIGMDEVIRYFAYQENPQIKGFEFEIPVKVRKGSWEAIFPDNIDKLAIGAFGMWMAGKYVGSALEEIAKSDFKDVSFKKIFKRSFFHMINVIKLSKHLGSLTKKKFEKVSFKNNNMDAEVINDKGKGLLVPTEVLELYSNCPPTLFNKITKIIETERELIIGVYEKSILFEEKITVEYKGVFTKVEDPEEVVLPDLIHDQYVELNGHVTRGNENSNTIGFLYDGHIITCYPNEGNIKEHKSKLFNNCIIKGFVDRHDVKGDIKTKRPRIRFIDLVSSEKKPPSLFD